MTNKESLREKFFEEHVVLESRIFSNKLYFKIISTPEDIFDFFWNEIQKEKDYTAREIREELEKIAWDTEDGSQCLLDWCEGEDLIKKHFIIKQ